MSIHGYRRAWKEVTGKNPCPKCQHNSWCRVSEDGDFCACCRCEVGGERRTDKNGEVYYLHRLKPSTNGEKWPEPQYSPSDCPKDEEGNPIPADPDLRYKVNSRLAACLPLRRLHIEELERRGIKDKQKEAGYRTLGRERAEAVLQLIKAGMEKISHPFPDSTSPRRKAGVIGQLPVWVDYSSLFGTCKGALPRTPLGWIIHQKKVENSATCPARNTADPDPALPFMFPSSTAIRHSRASPRKP